MEETKDSVAWLEETAAWAGGARRWLRSIVWEMIALHARVTELSERLEIANVIDREGNRVPHPTGEPGDLDGIACRDETIRLQDRRIDELRARVAELEEAMATQREQIALALEHEAAITPDDEDAAVTRENAALVRHNFSYRKTFDGDFTDDRREPRAPEAGAHELEANDAE